MKNIAMEGQLYCNLVINSRDVKNTAQFANENKLIGLGKSLPTAV